MLLQIWQSLKRALPKPLMVGLPKPKPCRLVSSAQHSLMSLFIKYKNRTGPRSINPCSTPNLTSFKDDFTDAQQLRYTALIY